jgi:hypothetical protein
MKPITRLLTLPAVILAAASLNAATVNVTAEDAEKLADIRLSHSSEEKSLAVVLDELREGLNRSAKRYLAEGATLDIHFTDIDLAGEFEPWRTGPQYDVRWVKEIYIPRLEFTYKLTGADGSVVAEGKESLRDTAFMMRANTALDRKVTHYESQMLSDWMRKFRKGEKS